MPSWKGVSRPRRLLRNSPPYGGFCHGIGGAAWNCVRVRVPSLPANGEKSFHICHFLGMGARPGCGRSDDLRLKGVFFVCALAAAGLPSGGLASGVEGGAVDLIGTWHVTVHYRDEASANPDAERWDDKLWRFETRGSRLQWTEYPIVVFENRKGRFDASEHGRPLRVLHFWQPNQEQLAEIEKGLFVNPRGAKSKGLRGSPSRGYRSAGGLRSESASVIGYSESWSVAGLPGKPVFTQDVVMGSGRTEDMQGRTRFTADVVSPEGNEVRGRFVRDGTRRGTFALRRAGAAILIGSKRDTRRGSR